MSRHQAKGNILAFLSAGAARANSAVVVVGSQFSAPPPVDLTITKNAISLSDDDFTVTDGNVMFWLRDNVLSLRDRLILLDTGDNPIISMQQRRLMAHRRWEVYRGTFPSIKISSLIQFKPKLDIGLESMLVTAGAADGAASTSLSMPVGSLGKSTAEAPSSSTTTTPPFTPIDSLEDFEPDCFVTNRIPFSVLKGMHPRVLVDGFDIAKRATLEFLEKFQTPIVMGDAPDKEILKMVSRTMLRTKIL